MLSQVCTAAKGIDKQIPLEGFTLAKLPQTATDPFNLCLASLCAFYQKLVHAVPLSFSASPSKCLENKKIGAGANGAIASHTDWLPLGRKRRGTMAAHIPTRLLKVAFLLQDGILSKVSHQLKPTDLKGKTNTFSVINENTGESGW